MIPMAKKSTAFKKRSKCAKFCGGKGLKKGKKGRKGSFDKCVDACVARNGYKKGGRKVAEKNGKAWSARGCRKLVCISKSGKIRPIYCKAVATTSCPVGTPKKSGARKRSKRSKGI